ncbi:hypothetical protein O5264_28730, partial [Escherichia coli]|nr:hypothetical protein [Escherichia coli]
FTDKIAKGSTRPAFALRGLRIPFQQLLAAASELLQHEHCTAEYAWQQVLKELSQQYQELDDEYLQARNIDVDDLLPRTLVHLTQTKE